MKIIKTERSIYLPGLKGYVFFVDEDKKGEECVIHDLFVSKEHRKRGMGTYLIKEALKEIFKAGYKKAFVVVNDKSLIPFYEKLGFVKTRYNEMCYFKEQNEAEKEGFYYIPAITYRRDKNGMMYDIKVDLENE